MRSLRRIGVGTIYPFLAAVYPILALYAANLREMVPLASLLAPALVSLVATAILLIGLRRAFGDWERAGALTLLVLALFFSYGLIWDALGPSLWGGHRVQLVAWGILLLIGALAIRALGADRIRVATPVLNLILAALVIVNGAAIARFQLNVMGDIQVARAAGGGGNPSLDTDELRDIYWIILDRYGSEDVVREYFDHDISSFVDALRDRGLYVADEATANYLKTYPSILATRNMDYLDGEELASRATAPDDWSPMYRDFIGSFRLLDFLRPLGYRFIYSGSHWEYTASHPEADINYVYDEEQDEFLDVLADATILQAAERFVGEAAALNWRQRYWERTRFQWESLHGSIRLGSPKFVHAHLALPHSPYIFEPDGTFVPQEVEDARSREQNYANNVDYANASVLSWVDALLAGDPEDQPIIIIQADEGPFPLRFEEQGAGFGWTDEATDEELHEKFGIMSAFYLPGFPGERAEEAGLYPSITPVNEFRVILNQYFGTDYELLPDRNYVWPDQTDVYQFVDATDRVRRMVIASD